MAQATPITPTRINVCALRVTALKSDGTVAAGPKNAFVTDKAISLGLAANVDAAAQKVLVSGCDVDIAVYNSKAKFRGHTLTLTMGVLAPALEDLLLGGAVILDDSTSPVPIGHQWPDVGASPPAVAVEAWSQLLIGNHSPAAADIGIQGRTYPYVRYLWPMVNFAPGDETLEADMGTTVMVGETQGNAAWGLGPYGDQGVASNANGFKKYDSTIPVAGTTWITAGSS